MQLRKIHGHSSLFRLEKLGCKAKVSFSRSWHDRRTTRKKLTSKHTNKNNACTVLFSLSLGGKTVVLSFCQVNQRTEN